MAEGKSVLVVDDAKRILESFKVILESVGCIVETAETGREAIEKSKNRIYDLALLDIKLPDMEGTEVLAMLHEKSPETIKIMMTGYPSLDNAVASLKLGADSYVMKPVNPEKLLKVVEKKLKEREDRHIKEQKPRNLRPQRGPR